MKSFINRIFKREEGSLTVEASLVLPIFICAVLTIGFFTKIIYTQETIQHAIDESVKEIASSSYIYYTSGIYDIDNTISSNLEERKARSEKHIDSILDCYKEIKNSIGEIKNSSAGVYQNIGNVGPSATLDSVDEITSQRKNVGTNVEDLGSVIQDIARDPRGEMISFASLVAKAGYDEGKTVLGNTLMKHYIKKHGLTESRLKALNIDKLDFSNSAYFENNQDIDVIVKYNVVIPLPIKFINHIPIVQRATARAWMGGDDGGHLLSHNSSSSEADKEESMDKEGEEDEKQHKIFYVAKAQLIRAKSNPKTELIYHTNSKCRSIYREPVDLTLKQAVERDKLRGCDSCKPPRLNKNNEEYIVYKNKGTTSGKYHKKICSTWKVEPVQIDREQLLNQGYNLRLCKICREKNGDIQ